MILFISINNIIIYVPFLTSLFCVKVGSMKSRWQHFSHKVLRWNRIDGNTKNVTTKMVSPEVEERRRNKPKRSPSGAHTVTEPQSPSKAQQASPFVTHVCVSLVTKYSFYGVYF